MDGLDHMLGFMQLGKEVNCGNKAGSGRGAIRPTPESQLCQLPAV